MKNFIKYIMAVVLVVLVTVSFAESFSIKPNSNAQLNSLNLANDSTITSQNKFLSLEFGGQPWGQPSGRMKHLTAATTLTSADSGKIFVLGDLSSSAFTVTLPEAEEDLEFTFILGSDATHTIDPTATDSIYCGDSLAANGATITATDKGDMIKIVGTDENTWMCSAVSLISDWTFN